MKMRNWKLRVLTILVVSIALGLAQVSAASIGGEGESSLESISLGETSSNWEKSIPEEGESFPSGYHQECRAEEYWDEGDRSCKNCTVCYPGTEHRPQWECGNDYGVKASCQPCREGYYQEDEGYSGLRCRPCVTCDEKVETLHHCKATNNTQCGPCPPGWYYAVTNMCYECLASDDREECEESRPSTLTPSPPPLTSTRSIETSSNLASVASSHMPSETTSSRALPTEEQQPAMARTWPPSTGGGVLETQAYNVEPNVTINSTTSGAEGSNTSGVDLIFLCISGTGSLLCIVTGLYLLRKRNRIQRKHGISRISRVVKYIASSNAPTVHLSSNTEEVPLNSVAPSSMTVQAGPSGHGSSAEESTLKGDESHPFLSSPASGTPSSATGNDLLPHVGPPILPTGDSQNPSVVDLADRLSGDSAQGASILSSPNALISNETGGDIHQTGEFPEHAIYPQPQAMIDYIGRGNSSCDSEEFSLPKSLKSIEPEPN